MSKKCSIDLAKCIASDWTNLLAPFSNSDIYFLTYILIVLHIIHNKLYILYKYQNSGSITNSKIVYRMICIRFELSSILYT